MDFDANVLLIRVQLVLERFARFNGHSTVLLLSGRTSELVIGSWVAGSTPANKEHSVFLRVSPCQHRRIRSLSFPGAGQVVGELKFYFALCADKYNLVHYCRVHEHAAGFYLFPEVTSFCWERLN